MSNEKNETAMVTSTRQEHLLQIRDNMAPGEKPAAIVPHTFAEVLVICQALATADLAPKNLRGKATDMALVIMTGAEVGLPPMASLRLYTTWDGVPRLMAEGVRAIILQSPAIEYFEMATCDDSQATWIGKRRGRPEKSVTWTIERARKAGLLDKPVWKAYQQDMLNARASMQLGRILAPDVVAGMVALEEARDGDFTDAQSVESKQVFVAPPPPQGPPPGVPVTMTVDGRPMAAAVLHNVTVIDTGTKPTEKRGPGRPPKNGGASQTPGTDPFRAAREAVDQRARDAAAPPSTTADPDHVQTAAAVVVDAKTGEVVKDRWGQSVADPSGADSRSSTSPAASSSPSPSAPASISNELGSSASTTETATGSSSDDGFGGEDPQDSQPVPTGDPGLQLIEDLKVFLGGCKSQTEMQNGRPPFAQRSAALHKEGDQRFAAAQNGKPAGELASMLGKLWAERKAQLPL